MKTHGMVLGKFLPPHLGHQYLIETARVMVDELTIVVGSLADEPISGALRYSWMKELFAGTANVVHLDEELPQDPSEHPDFWQLWTTALNNILPHPVDVVFASEDYGWQLADVLGARFMPVDKARTAIPVSGTIIRENPVDNFNYLIRPARPHFVKRISIFGPESTGKSTLTEQLAKYFDTAWVPEYARTLIEMKPSELVESDMINIAKLQIASEDALARNANKLLFCDTDPLATWIWNEELFGHNDEQLKLLSVRHYEHTFLLDVDVPWVDDAVRFRPDKRREFFDRCESALIEQGRAYTVIKGNWDERLEQAKHLMEELFMPDMDKNTAISR